MARHATSSYLGSWLRYMAGSRLAPYVPAPSAVGTTMLQLARLSPHEVVLDLGCGDGRLLRQAVHEFGAASAVGYELDEGLVATARDLNGDDERLCVRLADALSAADDIARADVVALYLTEAGNAALLPLLRQSMRPTARVVSYCWGLAGLAPTRSAVASGEGVVLSLGRPNVLLWERADVMRDAAASRSTDTR